MTRKMLWVLLLGGCDGSFGDIGETGMGFSGCFDTGSAELLYADVDGDGFGDPDAALNPCTAPADFVADNTDCDDANANVNGDADEVCGDNIDQDCSGADLECESEGA